MDINIKFIDDQEQFKELSEIFQQEYTIPIQTSPQELNTLFTSLINQEQMFNFYSNEQLFYQDSLEQFMKQNGLTQEQVIQFTFALSLQPPKHLQTIETKNWNSKVFVNEKYVITSDYDGNINLIMPQGDQKELQLVHTLNLSKAPLVQLVNIQEDIFITGGYDGKLYLIDITSNNEIEHIYHLSNKQLSIEQIFKLQQNIIAVRYENNLILTYKLCFDQEEKIQLLNTYKFKDQINTCFYLSDNLIILQSLDNNLILYDLQSNRQLKKYKFDYLISAITQLDCYQPTGAPTFATTNNTTNTATATPTTTINQTLIITCQQHLFQIKFDIKNIKILKSQQIKDFIVKIVTFQQNRFLLTSLLGNIQIRDIRSSRPLHIIDLYKFDIDKKRDQTRVLDCVYFQGKCYIVGSQRSVEVFQVLQ